MYLMNFKSSHQSRKLVYNCLARYLNGLVNVSDFNSCINLGGIKLPLDVCCINVIGVVVEDVVVVDVDVVVVVVALKTTPLQHLTC